MTSDRSWLSRLGLRRRSRDEREALELPPLSRGMQAFAMLAFFALGGLVVGLVLWNPLDIGLLPSRADDGDRRAGGAESHGHADAQQLYQCPMHPEVIESEPADCPICGMDLVPMKQTGDGKASGERKVLYWYAPMDPAYIRDEPGLSPMGMKLVPKYADEGQSSADGTISIDPVQVQNIGVASFPARREDIARTSRTIGILDFNAKLVTWINVKFEGWIEKVHVNYVGQQVTRGQPLFEIYSPELVTTQEEYLRALDYRGSLRESGRPETLRQAESLVRSTRERLSLWDISDEQIRRLEETRLTQRRLTVNSPAEGVVAKVMDEALEGMYVRPGMDLYKIADLSTVWVHADVYEQDFPWIREGQEAVVRFRHDPDRVLRGKVLFLYPEVSRETRTLKICVEVSNPDRRLRPGMYADVSIEGPPVSNAVVVPESAVIRSGRRDIVFVDLGAGRFQPREVVLGVKGERDRIQVVDGVAPGEMVVTQSQFLLDSESRIQEAIAKFMERGQARAEAPSDSGSQQHQH